MSGEESLVFSAVLTASQAIPAPSAETPPKAIGNGTLLLNPSERTLRFAFAYRGLSGPVGAAHFHNGPPGEGGPVVQTVCGAPEPALLGACPSGTSGFLQGSWEVPQDLMRALQRGQLYFQLHTQLNGPGELRGQILPQ